MSSSFVILPVGPRLLAPVHREDGPHGRGGLQAQHQVVSAGALPGHQRGRQELAKPSLQGQSCPRTHQGKYFFSFVYVFISIYLVFDITFYYSSFFSTYFRT